VIERNGTAASRRSAMDEELLAILACPACHTSVERQGEGLLCPTCGRLFPIRNGIPVMVLSEAEGPGEVGDPTDRGDEKPSAHQENS